MAKIKIQKKKKVAPKAPVENEEVALPSTRKSDDVIPKKVKISRIEKNFGSEKLIILFDEFRETG